MTDTRQAAVEGREYMVSRGDGECQEMIAVFLHGLLEQVKMEAGHGI